MARGRWARIAPVLLLPLMLVSMAPPSVSMPGPDPVRVLLVGDSVTQGSAGDWTWRHRLWHHLVDSGTAVDFVGPRDDLFDNVTSTQGSHAYVDPAFDPDHAARWGMSFATQDVPIGDLVEEYRPDVVVEQLGINDLAWDHRSPTEVAAFARRFVEDARAADPSVAVVLGGLPQTWVPGAQEYDASLPALASELSTDRSSVVAASPEQPFVEGTDTYDAAHPTATGEVKIAAGVADALAVLGVGEPYRPLPVVPNGPRVPAALSVQAGDGEAALTWQSPPGATAEYVWIRDATIGEPWVRLPYAVMQSTFTAGGLTNYDTYQFRLQAEKGWVAAEDLYSDVATVTPQRPAPGPVPGPGGKRVGPRAPGDLGAERDGDELPRQLGAVRRPHRHHGLHCHRPQPRDRFPAGRAALPSRDRGGERPDPRPAGQPPRHPGRTRPGGPGRVVRAGQARPPARGPLDPVGRRDGVPAPAPS